MAKDTSKLSREQQKELARLKFTREGKTFVEISEEIGVSRQTLSRWAKDGRWEEFKTAISLTNEERLRSAYQQLTEFDRMIEARPEGKRFPADNRESNIRKMLVSDIRDLQTEVGVQDVVSVFSGLISWLRKSDLEETKRLTPILDEYIKSKL